MHLKPHTWTTRVAPEQINPVDKRRYMESQLAKVTEDYWHRNPPKVIDHRIFQALMHSKQLIGV